jgi:hypothetical protein
MSAARRGRSDVRDNSEPGGQVHRAPYSGYYALWQGRLVNRLDGRIRLFESELEARAFLIQCDAAGRIIQNAPAVIPAPSAGRAANAISSAG